MAIGVRAGAGANRGEEFNTCFTLKEFGAERAAYRLQRIRESHLLSDIAQSNANLLVAGSARRRYVMLDDVPPDMLSRGHGGFLRKYVYVLLPLCSRSIRPSQCLPLRSESP